MIQDSVLGETTMATVVDNATKQGFDAGESSVPAVAVENLQKTFGIQRVLNGISLTINRGQTLAVLGRSGTGKSVLLRIIIGLVKPDSGSVRIAGQEQPAFPSTFWERSERRWAFCFSTRLCMTR
jgi:phospholipid/cholesterol/gamma-HCH transport system ATP-binding protein